MKACALSTTLAEFKATISHIVFCTGYAPNDWKNTINTMIEKKGKENLVSDLRIVNLIEADFNYNNKIIVRIVMKCTKNNNLIPKEQYSSRKALKAINQVSNKYLIYDLAHLQRRPIALCSNDEKSL